MIRTTLCVAFAVILIPSTGAAQSGQTAAQYNQSMADIRASCQGPIQKMIKVGMAHGEGGTPAEARQIINHDIDDIIRQIAKLPRKEVVDGLAQLQAEAVDPYRTPTTTCVAKRRLAQLDGAKLIH
jgi:hypothetical protein